MTGKNGNKRKISLRYICWLIGSVILFTAFFFILVLHYRIFDKYETAEIIRINGITDPKYEFYTGELKISFMVDGEEFTAYFQEPVRSTLKKHSESAMKFNILRENRIKFFPNVLRG